MVEILRLNDSINAITGLECYGVKEGKNGLGIVKCRGRVAGVFTENRIKAAPVMVTSEHIKNGWVEGIIVNSGNANAYTGEEGIKNAKRMAELLAEKIGCDAEKVAVCSTGVIGRQLDMEWIEKKVDEVYSRLSASRKSAEEFAKSIMTTDRYPKEFAVKFGDCIVAGVAKGAGMIAPNMATMLAFIFTNAKVENLYDCLGYAVDRSFNVMTVDGDTSTNDTVLLISTDEVEVDEETFKLALKEVCFNLAKMIVRDGEGATKVFEVHVHGAKSDEDAFNLAKSVASSLLVKTAVFGCDPNWGRIIAALGYAGVDISEDITLIFENDDESIALLDEGKQTGRESEAEEFMRKNDDFRIAVRLKLGDGYGYAIGCDLTYDYVKLNAEYTT
ncbi:glutamate N-acetyltransferase/amino-acid acetyltransferase [Archaeoglobus sulfaticallidus PM70-1]|uniref:Arginine biosynthesis bifunctional protein ArgJ n=1 Tax=Archaeoglobus sulfaticallidus PM70-1 TaxID=387631 RepID=N0BIW1_9EURY|nr:bifunctional ornithine acetyltransferase/N-acetylglutamate synthase [Archaeoglobus sulfaticallidus]AGK60411.1 glutamate N-acetyltransferase/amino-acid acetyltransferase [Archaeoglobus sulfaticallidus PM70-1]